MPDLRPLLRAAFLVILAVWMPWCLCATPGIADRGDARPAAATSCCCCDEGGAADCDEAPAPGRCDECGQACCAPKAPSASSTLALPADSIGVEIISIEPTDPLAILESAREATSVVRPPGQASGRAHLLTASTLRI